MSWFSPVKSGEDVAISFVLVGIAFQGNWKKSIMVSKLDRWAVEPPRLQAKTSRYAYKNDMFAYCTGICDMIS